jgi:LasA protease
MHRLRFTHAYRVVVLFAVLSLVLLSGTISFSPAVRAQAAEAQPTVEAAVNAAITAREGAPPAHGTFVDVKRQSADGQWAFGTVVLLASTKPHAGDENHLHAEDGIPEAQLWLARRTANGWEAALDYSPRFTQWVPNAPSSVVDSKEKAILGSTSTASSITDPTTAATAVDMPVPAFGLPFGAGQQWRMSGGPHSWSAKTTTRSALDFAPIGSDTRVVASRDGLLYRPCGNTTMAIVRHADGWQTDYYHLSNMPLYQEGNWIESGRYLGNASMAIGCGGSATGPHVHFNIRYQGEHIAWNGRSVGGWTISDGAEPYEGCATRSGARVCETELVTNYDVPPTAYDGADPAIAYSGSWTQQTSVANTYGSTIGSSSSVGSNARLNFTGRRVSLLYSMLPNGGSSDIYIDNQYRETISHRAPEARRQVIKTWEIGYGKHTIDVRVKGGGVSDVDAFAVNLVPASAGFYDNTNAQWRFVGPWQNFSGVPGAADGTVSWSATPGAAMRFMFTGDRIAYVHTNAPTRGIAAITIDGVDKGYIDLYAPQAQRQQSTTFAGLGPGVHVLHVTVTGQKADAAQDRGVDVDQVVITSDFVFVPVAMGGQ